MLMKYPTTASLFTDAGLALQEAEYMATVTNIPHSLVSIERDQLLVMTRAEAVEIVRNKDGVILESIRPPVHFSIDEV
jgi:hypothetical protein